MPRRWAESPNDLHDYANPVSPRRVSRRAHGVTGQSTVTDDWPNPVPIDDAELRAIEGNGTFARDQVRAIAQRVEVVSRKEVRIRGLRSELLRTLTAASGVEATVPGVHAFELKWRARQRNFERPF
jgi:hypothetical protein